MSPSATPTPYPPACRPPPTRTWSGASGARTARCGRRRARPRSPTGSAGWTSRSARGSSSPSSTRSATSCCAEGYTDAVVLGMGGSSLAPEVFRQSFGPQDSGLDAARPGLHAPGRGPRSSSTRSTSTRRSRSSPPSPAGRSSRCRCTRRSAPRSGRRALRRGHRPGLARWRQLAGKNGFRARLLRRPGHRRALQRALAPSASSPPPSPGFDVAGVLDSAIGAAEECRGEQRQRRPVARLRARRARPPGPRQAHVRRRRAAELLRHLGRAARAPSPPASSAAASCRSPTSRCCPDAYGDDRVFLHVALDDADNASTLAALKDAGHPVITIRALGPTDLGRIFFLSEFAVAVAGWALELNPFDQPNVQEAKDNTNRVLKEGSGDLEAGSLSELTDGLEPPHYFAIMGYLPYSAETEAAVARLREAVLRALPRRDDVGLRPALPALDRPVPQGRPEDRPLPAARRRARRGPRDPRRAVHASAR